jgi:hypothetical protein
VKCAICAAQVDGGVIVHSACLLAHRSTRKQVLAEVEQCIETLRAPDLPYGVNHNYDEGYRLGMATALTAIKNLQAGR